MWRGAWLPIQGQLPRGHHAYHVAEGNSMLTMNHKAWGKQYEDYIS